VFISRLHLLNFRNYENQQINFSPGKILIYGANGQGKTNILEAIYYLIVGKSFRGKDNSLIRFGAQEFQLGAKINKNEQKITLGIEFSAKGKSFLKNGQKQKGFSSILGLVKGVLFTPDDSVNFFALPSNRRKSLDLFLAQVNKNYLLNLIYYNKVLANKNALLKQLMGENLIEAWNTKLAEYGAEIIKEREKSLKILNELMEELNQELKFLSGKIKIFYKPQGVLDKEKFFLVLKQKQKEERLKKISLIGPHRDDFTFLLNDHDLKTFGSQGQKKGVLLLYKLATAVYMAKFLKEKPLLLLDDLYSEFDQEKRNKLEGFFTHFSEQIYITATDSGNLKNYDQAVLINDGKVI